MALLGGLLRLLNHSQYFLFVSFRAFSAVTANKRENMKKKDEKSSSSWFLRTYGRRKPLATVTLSLLCSTSARYLLPDNKEIDG